MMCNPPGYVLRPAVLCMADTGAVGMADAR